MTRVSRNTTCFWNLWVKKLQTRSENEKLFAGLPPQQGTHCSPCHCQILEQWESKLSNLQGAEEKDISVCPARSRGGLQQSSLTGLPQESSCGLTACLWGAFSVLQLSCPINSCLVKSICLIFFWRGDIPGIWVGRGWFPSEAGWELELMFPFSHSREWAWQWGDVCL